MTGRVGSAKPSIPSRRDRDSMESDRDADHERHRRERRDPASMARRIEGCGRRRDHPQSGSRLRRRKRCIRASPPRWLGVSRLVIAPRAA